MSIKNLAPSKPVVTNLEVGYTKALISFSAPYEKDVVGLAVYSNEIESYKGEFKPTFSISLPSVVKAFYYDSLVADTPILSSYAASAAGSFNEVAESITALDPVSIISLSLVEAVSTGYETVPSYIKATLSTSCTVVVEANSANAGWVNVGTYTTDETNAISFPSPNLGDTLVRVKGVVIFSNGDIDSQTNWYQFGSSVTVTLLKYPPAAPSNFTATPFRVKNGLLERADLKISFNWINQGSTAREFKLSWVEITDLNGVSNGKASNINDPSTVSSWDNEVSLGISTEYYLTNIKPGISGSAGVKYAFRLQAVGWDTSVTSSYIYGMFQISRAAFEALPVINAVTNIDITDYHIRGSNGGTQTFLLNGVDGSLSLGANSEISLNSSGVVTVKGSIITDDLEAAGITLSWLSGVAPSIKTSNKTSYEDTDTGIWMGYTDPTTFKFNIGGLTNYLKWNGSELNISGNLGINKSSYSDTNAGAWIGLDSGVAKLNVGNDSLGKYLKFDGTDLVFGPNTTLGINSDRVVTVGPGGQFSSIVDALEVLSRTLISYKRDGNTTTIQVIDGHVETNQIYINNIDLSWITITGDILEFQLASGISAILIDRGTSPVLEFNRIRCNYTCLTSFIKVQFYSTLFLKYDTEISLSALGSCLEYLTIEFKSKVSSIGNLVFATYLNNINTYIVPGAFSAIGASNLEVVGLLLSYVEYTSRVVPTNSASLVHMNVNTSSTVRVTDYIRLDYRAVNRATGDTPLDTGMSVSNNSQVYTDSIQLIGYNSDASAIAIRMKKSLLCSNNSTIVTNSLSTHGWSTSQGYGVTVHGFSTLSAGSSNILWNTTTGNPGKDLIITNVSTAKFLTYNFGAPTGVPANTITNGNLLLVG